MAVDDSFDRLVSDSLQLINDARRKFDKELIPEIQKGVPEEPESCPIANSLEPITNGHMEVCQHKVIVDSEPTARKLYEAWGTDYLDNGEYGFEVELPYTLQHFVKEFDSLGLTDENNVNFDDPFFQFYLE